MPDYDRSDFTWSEEDEPHAIRRKAILAKHPEIMTLFGPDIRILPVVIALVTVQVATAIAARNLPWPLFILVAWAWGGTWSHMLSLAGHELSHSLCFESVLSNEILGMFANFGQGLPSIITFKKYHLEHHQKQGHDGVDVDIPTLTEAYNIRTPIRKLIFLLLQPFFYAIRPMLIVPKPLKAMEAVNIAVQIAFDLSMVHFFGVWSLVYLLMSTFLGLGLHPTSGHFIAEHYEFTKDQETYSYYGILNYVAFNVGYHNEHHDFPRIPGFRLPQVKAMAPEFYELPHYDSWVMVLYNYVMDSDMGPFNRIKRERLGSKTEKVQ